MEGRATTDKHGERQELQEPVTITLPRGDSRCRPSKTDMEREYDMPGLSQDGIRATSFGPSPFCERLSGNGGCDLSNPRD